MSLPGRRPHMRYSTNEAGEEDKRDFLPGEKQNDERLSHLHSQVSTLKNITIEIGNEVREQNRLLDGMGLDFDKAGSMLSKTMQQLKDLMSTEQGRGYVLYSAIFFVIILFVLFLWAL